MHSAPAKSSQTSSVCDSMCILCRCCSLVVALLASFNFHVQSVFLIQVCALNVKKRLAKVSLFDSAQSEHTHTRTVHIHITIPLVWNSRRLTPHVMLLSVMSRQTIGSQGIVRYEATHSNFVVIFLHLTL